MKPFFRVLFAFACVFVGAVGARAQTQTISITAPSPYSVWQQSAGGTGPIPITGSFTGSPTTIQARFAGGAWTLIATNPTNGTFAGTLHNQPVGDGTLEVRFGNVQTVTDSVANVAVGDVYVITGQSNALGQGNTLNTIDPSLPTFASAFREIVDDWAIADDPVCTGGLGSPWPLLANAIITQSSVPVGFISVAESGQSLLLWETGRRMNLRVFDQIDKATAGTNRIKAVLWYQGESDMIMSDYAVTPPHLTLEGNRSKYHSKLKAFADEVKALPGAPKVVVGQTNVNHDSVLQYHGCDNIRAAQSDLWDDPSANVLSGPVTYDIDLSVASDSLHFKTDIQMQEFAERWWAAVHAHFYGGADGIGPRLLSANHDAAFQVITLKFTDVSLPLGIGSPGGPLVGFTVDDPLGVTSDNYPAAIQGSDTVIITVPQPFSSQTKVSLGLGPSAWGLAVPVDGVPLKAVPFLRVPVLP